MNNAGIFMRGAVEDSLDDLVGELLETNFFGTLHMIRAVLPSMQAARSRTIVNVTATAGFAGFPGRAAYAASKFAIEGMSESLYLETRPFGITVHLVEPGAFPGTSAEDRALHVPGEEASVYREVLDDCWSRIAAARESSAGLIPSNEVVARAVEHAIHDEFAGFHIPAGYESELIPAGRRPRTFEQYLRHIDASLMDISQ